MVIGDTRIEPSGAFDPVVINAVGASFARAFTDRLKGAQFFKAMEAFDDGVRGVRSEYVDIIGRDALLLADY